MGDLSINLVILFVDRPEVSSHFYRQVFNRDPVESSSTFVMFALPNGVNLGLWSRHTAQPLASAAAGSSEIALVEKHVDDLYDAWKRSGITLIQEPITNEAGRNFVAVDPDGHRIRVFWPEGETL